MHYVRKIEQDKTDVRSKSYYVYKCSICSEEKWFNWVQNFDTSELRKCCNCGVIDDSNNYEYLVQRKHQIEQKLQTLKTEIQKLSIEMVDVSSKLDIINTKEKVLSNN